MEEKKLIDDEKEIEKLHEFFKSIKPYCCEIYENINNNRIERDNNDKSYFDKKIIF